MIRRLGPLALLVLWGWGCGEPRLIDNFSEGLTRLRLVPGEFVGSVPCQRNAPGALQFYSVNLFFVVGNANTDAGLSPVFSSGAIPCDQAVMFPGSAGSFYAAEIRGFDRAVSDIEVDTVPPRWTASCGKGSAIVPDAGLDPYRPTISVRGFTVPIRGCTEFFDAAPGSVAGQIVVDQPSALGELRCGLGAGRVARFEGSLNGVTRTAACGEPLAFDVAGAERFFTVALTAFEVADDGGAPPSAGMPASSGPDASADAGEPLDASLPEPADGGAAPLPVGVARWRTECVGRSLPGVAARAYCDPLQPLR